MAGRRSTTDPLRTRPVPFGSIPDLNGPQTGPPPKLSKRIPPDPIWTPVRTFKFIRTRNGSDKVRTGVLNFKIKLKVRAERVFDSDKVQRGLCCSQRILILMARTPNRYDPFTQFTWAILKCRTFCAD